MARQFKDFPTKARADEFKASLPRESKARVTVRRSWIGLKSARKLVVTFAVNYDA